MIGRHIALIALSGFAAALSGCGGGDDPGGGQSAAERAADANILTAEYLAGEWCYVRYEAGGDVEEQQITYRFEADGSLLYQNNSGTPVEQPGTFEIGREGLEISPTFSAFPPMRAASIDPDRLTLLSMGAELLWTRGACGG